MLSFLGSTHQFYNNTATKKTKIADTEKKAAALGAVVTGGPVTGTVAAGVVVVVDVVVGVPVPQ